LSIGCNTSLRGTHSINIVMFFNRRWDVPNHPGRYRF
jgi:hypothetical protein